jgi:hyperosmotically inducible periplasmic protein
MSIHKVAQSSTIATKSCGLQRESFTLQPVQNLIIYLLRDSKRTMKKLTPVLLGMLLATSVVACQNVAKTSSEAPNSTAANPGTVDKPVAQPNQDDATSEMRRKQLNANIRANEQRNDIAGDQSVKADGDLESEVSSKLEANLPASALAIDAKNGVITVTGSVVNENQLQKIEMLAKEIKGVKSVTVKATVSAVTPAEPPKPGSDVPIKTQTGPGN